MGVSVNPQGWRCSPWASRNDQSRALRSGRWSCCRQGTTAGQPLVQRDGGLEAEQLLGLLGAAEPMRDEDVLLRVVLGLQLGAGQLQQLVRRAR